MISYIGHRAIGFIDAVTPSLWRGSLVKRAVSLTLLCIVVVAGIAIAPIYIALPITGVIVFLLGLDFYRNRIRIEPPAKPTPRETVREEIVTEEILLPPGYFAAHRQALMTPNVRGDLNDAQMVLRATQTPSQGMFTGSPTIEDRFHMFQPRVTTARNIPTDMPNLILRRVTVRRQIVRENMSPLAIEAPKKYPLWLRAAMTFSSIEAKINGVILAGVTFPAKRTKDKKKSQADSSPPGN